MTETSEQGPGRPRRRLGLLVAGVAFAALAIVGAGVEWGRLLVRGRLIVIDDGLSLWQGVVVLIAAAVGAIAMAFAATTGRTRLVAVVALASGAAITAISAQTLTWLVMRPEELAEQIRAGAQSIPLTGYVVPRIESMIGPGVWMALIAGLLLALTGLVGIVVPGWRRRRAG